MVNLYLIVRMIMVDVLFDFLLIGIISALLGIFYRNCLKSKGMIFNFIYYKWLKQWAELPEELEEINLKGKITKLDRFKAWIAYPLGYCMYCSTIWITFILCGIYLTLESNLCWQCVVLGIIAATGIQHIILVVCCKYLIYKHPDLYVEN